MNRRNLWAGVSAFVVTSAAIAGCWAMAVADISGAQRVSRVVGNPLPIASTAFPLPDIKALGQFLARHPALEGLLPWELRFLGLSRELWREWH